MDECEHRFVYGGVKYQLGRYPLPGSGAYPRFYFDWFFCEKCLSRKYVALGAQDNSYEKIQFGATPNDTYMD